MLARVTWVRPDIAVKNKPRKMNGDRKKRLVAETCIILKTGEPTHFAFEASCRHGLRSALCLDGWAWADADKMAAEIVNAALMIIGAKRPTWQQGQPEWTQHGAVAEVRDNCKRCSKSLPEGYKKYCSMQCAQAEKQARLYQRRKEEMRAYARARYAAGKLHPVQPPRPCETCGKYFSPRKKNARFCSTTCSNKRDGANRFRASNYRGPHMDPQQYKSANE